MSMDVHYSSETDEWVTPQEFYDKLAAEFGFTLDPCATKENAKCQNFYTLADNGLAKSWDGQRVFMNPPYGRSVGLWVNKAYTEVRHGGCELVVCLVPARTDTAWWHLFCMKGQIRFVRGRIGFVGAGGSGGRAPFPSALVIFDRLNLRAPREYESHPLFAAQGAPNGNE